MGLSLTMMLSNYEENIRETIKKYSLLTGLIIRVIKSISPRAANHYLFSMKAQTITQISVSSNYEAVAVWDLLSWSLKSLWKGRRPRNSLLVA